MSNKFCIHLNNYIIDTIKYLIFEENNNIVINIKGHKNYIYKKKIGYITYIFNGFYKEEYFIITIDSFHETLQTNIEHKDVIILKLDWYIKDNYYIINIPEEINKNENTYILPIRKNIFEEYYIQNYLKTNNLTKNISYIYKYNKFIHGFTKLNIHNFILSFNQ